MKYSNFFINLIQSVIIVCKMLLVNFLFTITITITFYDLSYLVKLSDDHFRNIKYF